MWQDIVLSIIGAILTIALIPQIIDVIQKKSKMNWVTCTVTSSACFVIAFVDYTLNLPISTIMSILTGIIWISMVLYPLSNK